MAKGFKTGGKDFPKGNSMSPGRPPIVEEMRQFQQLNQVTLKKILSELIAYTPDQLRAKIADPTATVFELAIASVIKQAVQKGDNTRINFLLDRIVGRTKEVIEIQNKYSEMSLDELKQLALEKLK